MGRPCHMPLGSMLTDPDMTIIPATHHHERHDEAFHPHTSSAPPNLACHFVPETSSNRPAVTGSKTPCSRHSSIPAGQPDLSTRRWSALRKPLRISSMPPALE